MVSGLETRETDLLDRVIWEINQMNLSEYLRTRYLQKVKDVLEEDIQASRRPR